MRNALRLCAPYGPVQWQQMTQPTPSIFKRLRNDVHRDLMKVCMPFPYSTYDDLSALETIVILLEDRRFFQHSGIDWRSLARELWKMCTLKTFGGASTIDMQFVRTRTGFKERTLRRKSYEMILAYLLQSHMDKIAILRTYLGVVYLGSGIYGIESAARKVFGKPLHEVTDREAALLAAMMVYPRPLSPTLRWRASVKGRAEYGMRLYQKHGDRYRRRQAP
jgi:membrane peptidoglycan carboxypeptidase